MSNSYQLKSHPDRLLYDHLRCVAFSSRSRIEEIFPKLYTNITLSDLARTSFIIGATHDIGKGTTFFQRYLPPLKQASSDPLLKSHSIISSLYCSWLIQNDTKISDMYRDFLVMASSLVIQGHHGSLKRPTRYYIGMQDTFADKGIFSKQIEAFERIDELEKITQNLGLKSFIEFTKLWEDHLNRLGCILRRIDPIKQKFDSSKEPYFLTNLLYSSLLDADIMNVANLVPERKKDEVRKDAVTSYLKKTKKDNDEDDDDRDNINKFRKMLYCHVEQKVDEQDLTQRIFTLTAPTGLGKTLTSINFALKMRDKIQRNNGFVPRIIYVAPFIAILDQNMKVLQEVFDTNQQTNILLMHHHLAPINFRKDLKVELFEEQKIEHYSTSQSEFLIQGWNSEIVVSTFVQFFNSIFGRYTSQLRRLKNLIGSIIILDEVQSIPFEYWDAVRDALLFLSKKFNITMIMMTATQPLIFTEDEAIEIAPKAVLQIPQRVTFHPMIKDAVKLNEFCMKMNWLIMNNPSENILIEVNTIASAVKVYESLQVANKIYFLSSHIIPKYRKPRIDMIKESLDKSEPIVLVSTQVIEAGVDLDFNIAVRDIGPIDSVVQTAGRCNRNGDRKSPSPFFIYRIVDDNGSEVAKKVYGKVSIDIANSLLEGASKVEDLVKPYYQSIKKQRSSQKSDDINIAISKLNYDEVEETFKLIDEEYKAPVFVEFDDDATKIWNIFLDLKNSKERPSRNKIIETRNQMEQYMIGVSPQDIKASNLEEFHGIYKINNSDIGLLYKEITGFVKQ